MNDSVSENKMADFGYRKVPADEKVEWVLRHFDTVAKKYDFMNTLLSFGIHLLWKRTAVRMLKLNPGDWVLDVCGGTGDLAILAGRVVGTNGRVFLFDINRMMMETGRPKVMKAGYEDRIAYVQGDAEQMSIDARRFDAAMVGFGIRNLTHLEEGFKEMYRVLKPGGKMMCLEFSRPTAPLFRWLYDFYSFHVMPFLGQIIGGSRQAYTYLPEAIRLFPSPDGLSRILKEIGFSHVAYRRLTNGIAVLHLAIKE